MLRHLLCLTLALPVATQSSDLLNTAWQVRNKAARTLAATGSIDIHALLQILRTDWHGSVVTTGHYGGRGAGGFVFEDPRARIRLGDPMELWPSRAWWHAGEPLIATEQDLALPWHPHALALWLIERSGTVTPRPGLTLPITNDYQARAWLVLDRPDAATMKARLADLDAGPLVAQALHTLGRRDALCNALATGDRATRSHVLATGNANLLDRRDCLTATLDFVLHDDDSKAVANVVGMVQRTGLRATEALLTALAATDNQRARGRGFMLLCRFPVTAASQSLALEHIGSADDYTRHRALYQLSREPLPADLRANAAQRLFLTVEKTADADSRLLAFDALGQCGEGVTAEQRQTLVGMLNKPRWPGSRARALGCLRQLGIASQIPLKVQQAAANAPFPTTTTWLALADEGPRGADVLAKMVRRFEPGVDTLAVVRRLVETAPQSVTEWLLGDGRKPNFVLDMFKRPVDASLRPIALTALRSLPANRGIRTTQLLALLATAKRPSNELIPWLTEREDLGDGAEQVYAWMVKRSPTWVPSPWTEFAEKHPLPTARMLELLAPMLRHGVGWELLAKDDREAARAACRAWLAEAKDGDTTTRLIDQLAGLGATNDRDIERVLKNLLGVTADRTLSALQDAPELPPRLRTRVEELVDSGDPHIAYTARELLRKRIAR